MEDKLNKYYILIDIFNKINKPEIDIDYDSIWDDETFFKLFSPFNMAVLVNYLKTIIYDMCDKFITKEKVREEISTLYNEENNSKDFKYKNISLKKIIKGEFSYLREIFILKEYEVPDNEHFINNYCYPTTDVVYPFSLKELYTKLLERGIDITINNYYWEKNKSK